MVEFVTQAEQITAQWLTEALKGSAALERGRVTAVEVSAFNTSTANAFPLRVKYSADAAGTLPEKLFLKLGRRYSETAFWQQIAPRTTDVPLVTCYYSAFANELGQSNLIFDDISETHRDHPDALPASQAELMRYTEIIATLHRQWWEHPDLKPDGALSAVLDDVPAFVLRQVEAQIGRFFDVLGDAISPKRRRMFEQVIAALPLQTVKDRIKSHDRVTLVHADTHFWNFAKPRGPQHDYLLQDWAIWHLNQPGYDLSYMIAVRCFPDYRARFEQAAIEHYVNVLNITGYDAAQCMEDYRMGVVFHMVWPIFWHSFSSPDIWYPAFECLSAAFESLGCEDFVR